MNSPKLPSNSAPLSPSYSVKPYAPPEESPKATIYRELAKAADGPGEMFNMMSGKHMEDVRDQYETSAPAKGVIYEMKETSDGKRASVKGFEDIPAPEEMNGKWDPLQFAPHYVFDKREDAFPVRPDYDGNASTSDNGADSLEGTGSDHYRDGVIDDQQALNSGFVVSQKGEYTVLTYNNYYATNKGADYHKNDYSTAQVYLKPDALGELKPAFLATSWHYGTVLTPWSDVRKDEQGHPVMTVGLGTHSLQPLGRDQAIPADGLHIQGDGTATVGGKAIGQKLTYDAFQSNVDNATVLSDPDADRAKARRATLGYGMAAVDPLDPSTFTKDDTVQQVKERFMKDLESAREGGGDEEAAEEAVREGGAKLGVNEDNAEHHGFVDKVKHFFSGL